LKKEGRPGPPARGPGLSTPRLHAQHQMFVYPLKNGEVCGTPPSILGERRLVLRGYYTHAGQKVKHGFRGNGFRVYRFAKKESHLTIKVKILTTEYILAGDSALVLGHFPDGYFDCIVTDPPHGLFFMGNTWDDTLPAQVIWEECFRVLKPGGHAWVMSSERWGCAMGLYRGLTEAGFLIDEQQIVFWLTLTGMPKSTDVSKQADKEALRAWLDHVGAGLSTSERRKAESAAVNGKFGGSVPQMDPRRNPNVRPSDSGFDRFENVPDHNFLASLIASYWPSDTAEQREHWEAVVGAVPDDWDTSRPPGVRIATGKKFRADMLERMAPGGKRDGDGVWGDEVGRCQYVTAPSTPDAAALDGWRGSVAPLKPLAYPILHAVKPWRGNYLDCARKTGGAVLNLREGAIPFGEEGAWKAHRATGFAKDKFFWRGDAEEIPKTPASTGRVPGNLFSYGDLLHDLQRYADLDAWCKRLGLPTAAAELLKSGAIYCPKPSKAEKSCGGRVDMIHPTCKPAALCAYLIVLSTREGQRVLDPFCGSGSTGVAAKRTGRSFIGVELISEYANIAQARIAATELIPPPTNKQDPLPL